MLNLNYIEVPSVIENDTEREQHVWKNGRCVLENRTNEVQVMLFHEDSVVAESAPIEGMEETPNGVPPTTLRERKVTKAFCFCVDKPLSRDKAINAAEMEAYNLRSAMDVAAFAASLSRKNRMNETADEVKEHDDFIERVKSALTEIGL
jgi:hypothetical protein|nr:MAG TPA: hypothetical protein [Caudoviricetes sp.]